MSGGIFLISDNGNLVELENQPYDSENLLQELLAKYPNLIAGEQINSASPRRWLLVKREKEIPSEEGGSGRWAVDHLFLDQEGIPTLVEVKRSSDTRIRREVVGQMLDYAANAVAYWPVETIKAQFEASCSESSDPDDILNEFLNFDQEVEQFWQNVKTNLQAGRIRLLFVADQIPSELRRVIEFLNNQMDPAEVLALELKQFVGQGHRTLVPSVIGQTMQAIQKKRPSGVRGDEASFFSALKTMRGEEEMAIARELINWGQNRGYKIRWTDALTALAILTHGDKILSRFGIAKNGIIYLDLVALHMNETGYLKEGDPKRNELFVRLKTLGFIISEKALRGQGSPSIRLEQLQVKENRDEFTYILDWIAKEMQGQ